MSFAINEDLLDSLDEESCCKTRFLTVEFFSEFFFPVPLHFQILFKIEFRGVRGKRVPERVYKTNHSLGQRHAIYTC